MEKRTCSGRDHASLDADVQSTVVGFRAFGLPARNCRCVETYDIKIRSRPRAWLSRHTISETGNDTANYELMASFTSGSLLALNHS